ncbi:MAG: Rieske (2Fe-2S) protein [Rhodospirillales bacterium]
MTVLCRLDDIADPGGKGFVLPDRKRIFVVRRGARIWGYRNVCPHQGVNLDWKPDVFLSVDKSVIQCATHFAKFNIDDGYCIAGPCMGRRLMPVAVRVDGGDVVMG